MSFPEPIIDTPIATVQRTGAGMVEVRFKAGSVLHSAGIEPILRMRDQLGREGPARVLIVMPEDMDFSLDMLTTDHYAGHPVQAHSRAVAWVVPGEVIGHMTRKYFDHYPPPVPTAIFNNEAEALDWLAQQ